MTAIKAYILGDQITGIQLIPVNGYLNVCRLNSKWACREPIMNEDFVTDTINSNHLDKIMVIVRYFWALKEDTNRKHTHC